MRSAFSFASFRPKYFGLSGSIYIHDEKNKILGEVRHKADFFRREYEMYIEG
jgi:hypothetical protein